MVCVWAMKLKRQSKMMFSPSRKTSIESSEREGEMGDRVRERREGGREREGERVRESEREEGGREGEEGESEREGGRERGRERERD